MSAYAYAILDLEIFDKAQLQEYKSKAPEIIKKYGGEIIVRGGQSVIVQGDWHPKRMVIIKFPSFEIANDWWNSDEYRKAIELRKKGANTKAIIIEGV